MLVSIDWVTANRQVPTVANMSLGRYRAKGSLKVAVFDEAEAINHRAMRVVVSGKGNTVTLNSSQAHHGSTSSIDVPTASSPDSWWQQIRKRGLVVGLSTFLAAMAGIAVWLEWTPWK